MIAAVSHGLHAMYKTGDWSITSSKSNLYGWIATFSLVALAITSINRFRRKNFEFFFANQ